METSIVGVIEEKLKAHQQVSVVDLVGSGEGILKAKRELLSYAKGNQLKKFYMIQLKDDDTLSFRLVQENELNEMIKSRQNDIVDVYLHTVSSDQIETPVVQTDAPSIKFV